VLPGIATILSTLHRNCKTKSSGALSRDLTNHQAKNDPGWIVGQVGVRQRMYPTVSTVLDWPDRLGSWKARWSIGRMRYRVEPGLYATGNPTDKSPVFVSANYKMSFDRLRAQLGGMDSWILVLDTKGVNVWCAAGKGTFGTDELVARTEAVGLARIVSHRRLILPQFGAVGVSAHEVKRRSGFRVIYGPVRAEDLPQFMRNKMKATPEMRQVQFDFRDRIVLAPTDIVGGAKYALMVAIALLFASGFGDGGYSTQRIATSGMYNALLLIIAYLAAAVLPAALLPWLPGRAFSAKGAWLGIVLVGALAVFAAVFPGVFRNWFIVGAWLCLIPALTSFMAMNFTGSSTYTSLSGVKKEMRVAVPLQVACAVSGLGLWITGIVVV
jgi:hypothetical protein